MEQDGILMDVAFHVDESKLKKLNETEFFNDNYLVSRLNSMIDCERLSEYGIKVINATTLVIKKDSGSMVHL